MLPDNHNHRLFFSVNSTIPDISYKCYHTAFVFQWWTYFPWFHLMFWSISEFLPIHTIIYNITGVVCDILYYVLHFLTSVSALDLLPPSSCCKQWCHGYGAWKYLRCSLVLLLWMHPRCIAAHSDGTTFKILTGIARGFPAPHILASVHLLFICVAVTDILMSTCCLESHWYASETFHKQT